MTTTTTIDTRGGIGFLSALFLVFLVLKLTEVVDWSWWWITAPLWSVFATIVAILLVVQAVVSIVALWKRLFFDNSKPRRARVRRIR